ncbi:hypothetical protein TRSC58_01106 [Trypanosoma rangeli SC58]|uniref:Uncharacterized protein n=1 Tax=Trypanosoma rangeli SC58 TaxID=429131 RepID=A0A061J6V2_TRYRA|nr:hypothetical protein TRSC58_01106 [Trypanosoma rangeli SC58]
MASGQLPWRGGRSADVSPLDLGGPLMLQFMQYLPLAMRLLTHLPGFLAGFSLVCLFFAVVGRDALQNEYAPVAGFHLAALLLLRELVGPWREGKVQADFVRQRLAAQRSFADDVQLQWREALD